MQRRSLIAVGLALMLKGNAMAQERILISSEWGKVTAELVDNAATRSLVQMLPLTIEMRDHLRQEKTGNLPSPLPAVGRQLGFSTGTLGLWSSDHFVIYYRSGTVPAPGIVLLGQVAGDVSIFDRPGSVSVRIERVKATMTNHFGFGGKVALVTGAAAGMGLATAKAFAEAGAAVVLADFREDAVQAAARDLVSAGGKALADAAT